MAPRAKTGVACSMCGQCRKKAPPSWVMNDCCWYCDDCWEQVRCKTCQHHDPKGLFVQGRWRCRQCRHKQKSQDAVWSHEACHQVIMEDSDAGDAVAELSLPLAELPAGPVPWEEADELEEECDEIAPLPQSCVSKSKASMHGVPSDKPNHVVLLLDASGSMRTVDVLQEDADGDDQPGWVCRLEAALQCAADFAAAHARMHPADVFSVATIGDKTEALCKALHAAGVREALSQLPVRGAGGTFYGPALAKAAALLDLRPAMPGHVLILSDGRPADTKDALALFQELFVNGKHGRARIHGIGFGSTVESFAPLQQLTCISSGSFTLSGRSVRGLCRAFSSVSSTITSMSASGAVEREERRTANRVPRPADFELPELGVFGRRGTVRFRAARASFRFDGQQFFEQRWSSGDVVRRVRPYMRGGMRLVYGCSDAQVNTQGSWMVAKCSRFVDEALNTRDAVAVHAKSTSVARYFASRFNEQLRSSANGDSQAPTLFFVPCYVYEVEGPEAGCSSDSAGSEPRCFAAERFLPGVFLKYNSNNGYVADEANMRHHEAIQAFLHFTFTASEGRLLVADLQGVARAAEVILTDPQVLSPERSFGPGDLGASGIRSCLAAHRCGPTCRRLGLQPVSAALLRKLGGKAPAVQGGASSGSSLASWTNLGPSSRRARGADGADSAASWERVGESKAQHFSLADSDGMSSQASSCSWVHVLDM